MWRIMFRGLSRRGVKTKQLHLGFPANWLSSAATNVSKLFRLRRTSAKSGLTHQRK